MSERSAIVSLRPRAPADGAAAGPEAMAESLGRLGTYLRDPRDGRLTVSAGLRTLLGWPAAGLEDWDALLGLLHPDDRHRIATTLTDSAAETVCIHGRCRRFDGQWLHVAFTERQPPEGDGGPVAGLIQDIGALLAIDDQMAQTEQRYRALIESQSDLVLRVDAVGHIIFVNPHAALLLGRPVAEIVGQPWQSLIHPDDVRASLKAFGGLWGKPGSRVSLESRMLTVEGVRWFAWDGYGIHDSGLRVIEVQAIGRDITRRREIEEALTRSEALFRSLIQNTPAPLSLDAWDDGRFLQINAAMERVLGYSAEELMAFGWRQITDPEDVAENDRMRERLLAGTSSVESMVKRFHRRDGAIVWGNLQLSLLRHPDGSPYAFIAQFMDISDRMRAEAALREAAARSEEAHRVKSDFLANMSHELRTPLNAIIGFSEMLEGRFFGPLTDKQREYVADIKRSGSHLLSIINDVLDMSKIEAGRFELIEEDLDPARAIDEGMRLIAAQADRKGVRLASDVPDALPLLRADSRAVRQILLNLLSNAVKFTPPGGTVAITVEDGPEGFRVFVRDTGIGIPPEMIETVLKPFGQVEGAMTRQHEGTGLGLSISRSLMELHGGELKLDSRPKNGTTVTMCFPRNRRVFLPGPR